MTSSSVWSGAAKVFVILVHVVDKCHNFIGDEATGNIPAEVKDVPEILWSVESKGLFEYCILFFCLFKSLKIP